MIMWSLILKNQKIGCVGTTNKLLASLQSHEDRINGQEECNVENAFHIKVSSSESSSSPNAISGKKGRGGYASRGRKVGRSERGGG